MSQLREIVESAAARLLMISDDEAARRPAPGKWSPKEIIGHLVDSAANNHGRFVRGRFQDHMVFAGYDQDAWIAAQDYGTMPWSDLVSFWRLYNLHIARVMELMPADLRHREHTRHNLHQIAWRTVPEDAPVTLDYFMRDYIGHLVHHLDQIPALRGA
jgi:hypothetical protein